MQRIFIYLLMMVKAMIFFMISLLFSQQSFQGMAVYESKTSTANMTQGWMNNREITPEMRARIEERMKAAFEKKFILNFDRNASTYAEEEKLDAVSNNQGGFRMMSSFTGGGGTHYKNLKEKIFMVDKEFFGREFLVKDSIPQYQWEMTGETKQIGAYMCYKATAKRPTSFSDFRNMRRRAEEPKDGDKKKEEVAEVKKEEKKEERTTNFMDGWEMPKEVIVTAWYTMDIPVAHGPENYGGLPGLILEVSDGTTTILCSKIVLNPKEKKEIKAPKNGKVVTQAEFDQIMKEKMEEMREMGGRPGQRSFRMGG